MLLLEPLIFAGRDLFFITAAENWGGWWGENCASRSKGLSQHERIHSQFNDLALLGEDDAEHASDLY